MNSVKIYKYLLIVLIVLILLVGALFLTKKTLIAQIKFVVFWYIIILELNLINIYSVLSFYERNKNRKGPKGFKGIKGPKGFKGESILCESCELSGQKDPVYYGRSFGINSDYIKPGRCVFPFLTNYQYKNSPVSSDPPFGLTVPLGATNNQWCATSVNNNFEPLTIAFYDSNLKSQFESEAKLNQMKKEFYQSNYGVLDIKLVYGNTTNEAKNMFSLMYEKNGYEFYEQDLNEGTGGKFIYMAVKNGVSSRGVKNIGVRFQDRSGSSAPMNPPLYPGFNNIVNRKDDEINLNWDSGDTTKHLYLYLEYGGAPFIKDVAVVREGSDNFKPGFVPIEYATDNLPPNSDEIDGIDFRPINNQFVDLNRGSHSDNNFEKLFLLKQVINNIISIDTAFKFKDNSVYMFLGDKFYKFAKNESKQALSLRNGYPKSIQEKFGKLPTLNKTGKEVEDCSIYNGEDNSEKCSNTQNCFFDSINKVCEPATVYDAAFVDQKDDTYFFKGQFIYKYNSKEMKIESGYPKLISQIFKGAPNNIDAAFVWAKDYHTYMFKGDMHYKINSITNKVERGYPKKNSLRWDGMPPVITAIFSIPYYIVKNPDGSMPMGNNHTYIISQNEVFYINPNTDKVSNIGVLSDIFIGLENLSTAQVTINPRTEP
jgi:hypothetical protein